MDFNIHGYDINRYVAYQARLNLEHFGYDPLLIHRIDIHELNQSYDVMIMDIPYGIYSPFTYSEQCSLLKEAYRIASRFLLISHIPMDKELQDIGFEIIESCRIQKGSFQRNPSIFVYGLCQIYPVNTAYNPKQGFTCKLFLHFPLRIDLANSITYCSHR